MDKSKIILSFFLVGGLIALIVLTVVVIVNGGGNEIHKYLLGGLFSTIGASIAILLDVEVKDPKVNTSSFTRLSYSVSFMTGKTRDILGIMYATVYFIIGIYLIIEAGGDNEFVTTLATSFAGLMVAVVGKYAIVKE
ncbi:MAG: hypothetical protein IPN79_12840 [Saprospiraceae bacterium]|nr:hypothetical protein [Saprospiraceae bacterium]